MAVEGGKKWKKSYFDVVGLCCSSEVPLVENILKAIDGIKEVSVIVPSRTVIVVHDDHVVSQLQIVKALNQARLEANVRVYGDTNYRKRWPSPYAVLCGLLLGLSFLKYVFHPLRWLALGAVAVGIIPIAWKGLVSIRNFRLDINILVLIAVIGTIAMNDYLEAGSIVFLFTVAEWLESRASHKATSVMSSLISLAPQKATIAETGEEFDVDRVKLNTVVAVKAGEVIPIDGIIVQGKCDVDEKTLTGESFPVSKQKDSTVWAGTTNLNGYISVKTTAVAEDCVVAKMAKLVEEAQNNKSKAQRFIDDCAKYYTPAVVAISVCLALVPVALKFQNRTYWFHLALVVLVSACPCALILSTPVATFCALSKAATSGLLIKGGDCLETLAKIKMVAFDKTGTLTRGEFIVTDFKSLQHECDLNTLLYWVSSIESKSSHPMADAIIDYSRSLLIEPKPDNVDEFNNFPGEGIHGKIDGKSIFIGNKRISIRAGCGTVPALECDTKEGKTVGYIYLGETPVGIFRVSDSCRSGVPDAIKKLHQMGIKVSMLTGDNLAAAMYAQNQIGHPLDVIHAELLPEDKLRLIEEFKKDGPTAMIGDGLNDAPALATADIGISMGISGSGLATETANIVLMSNDIRKIPKAIELAQKAHRKVIQNVILSITTKAFIIAYALAGHPLIWAAVLADTGTCLLVIFNSMLLLRGTGRHGGKCCKSSTVSEIHKHGCQTGGNHHHHCSSDSNARKECELNTSSANCGSKCQSSSKNCTDAALRQHDSVGCGKKNEAVDCDHGSCGIVHHNDLNNSHNHPCGKDNHVKSIATQGSPVGGDELHKIENNHLEGCNTVHCVTGSCSVVHSKHSSSVPEEVSQTTDTSSCQDKCKTLGRRAECAEKAKLAARHGCILTGKDEAELATKHACTMTGKNEAELTVGHACRSFQCRETDTCCKSYLKECCGTHGRFGPGFGGDHWRSSFYF